jgi:hypothetical protein
MKTEVIRDQFVGMVMQLFPELRLSLVPTRNRVNIYLPYQGGDKRWMQLDRKSESVSIIMDHEVGTIKESDLEMLNIQMGLTGGRTGIQLNKNSDHVSLTVFEHEPIEFRNEEFVNFLKKHFEMYKERLKGKKKIFTKRNKYVKKIM